MSVGKRFFGVFKIAVSFILGIVVGSLATHFVLVPYFEKEASPILKGMDKKLFGDARDAENAAEEQFTLGVTYYQGRGVVQDYVKARELWEEASRHGNAKAQYNLGVMYVLGQGVVQDFDKARELWMKAAAQGEAYAQHNLEILEKKHPEIFK